MTSRTLERMKKKVEQTTLSIRKEKELIKKKSNLSEGKILLHKLHEKPELEFC